MKLDRLISIIIILLDKKRISANELSNIFGVSSRTIYRDIETINLAGVPISSISGVGGGFEIMPNYKIDKQVFSSSDIIAILTGLSSISNIIKNDELINTITKVKGFIHPDKIKDIESKTNHIYVDLTSWIGNKNIQNHLEIIQTALFNKKLLSFEYRDRHGNNSLHKVEAYQLLLKGNSWYFYGYCHKRNDFRLFKLSRISNINLKKEFSTIREYKKPQLEIGDILSTLQTNIKIRIHKSIMDEVLNYSSFENFTQDKKDYYIVNFPFIENDYYYNILLSFGDKCECLNPEHIRTEIKQRLYNMINIYN